METKYYFDNGSCYITIYGPMTNTTLVRIKDRVKDALKEEVREVWVNCEAMTDVDLSILGSLALYQHVLEERNVKLTLLHLNPQQQNILVKNQLDTILPVANETALPLAHDWNKI
ncbi:STAS domain-containing protein [Pontibacter rugosus]|uniref:STAS domain-containing protein n=1 Tax=Pontibacter rugosus TaxID=1745966 RepID=A0ABW3SUK6_9BACT